MSIWANCHQLFLTPRFLFPFVLGRKALIGLYGGLDMPVPRSLLRASVNGVRASRLSDRPRRTIIRCQYWVEAPLSIVHIEVHHKLIKFLPVAVR